MILAGNLRYEVAKEQGIEEIQVICLEHLSDDDIKAFIIAENRIAELAGWDKEVLKIELQYLTDIGYETILTGFEIPEIDLMINETVINETSEDELPNDLEIIPRSKVGDIWELAKHILINGDALDYKVYQLLFKDGKADVAFVTATAYLAPQYSATACSNFSIAGPCVKKSDFKTSITALISCSSIHCLP